MSWPAPTSSGAAVATTPQPSARSPSLFASLFKGGKSNDEDDEGAALPSPSRTRSPRLLSWPPPRPPNPPIRCRRRARSPVAATIQLASADAQIVPAPKAKPRPSRGRQAAGFRRQGRAETADARRYHQCPRLLGRRADDGQSGHARAGRSPQGPPGRRRRRSAADRQRFRGLQQGAGLCAGRLLAGRSRQRRRRLRADPAHRPAGAQRRRCRHRNQHRGRQGTRRVRAA